MMLFILNCFVQLLCCMANISYRSSYFNIEENQQIMVDTKTREYFVSGSIGCSRFCLDTIYCCKTSFVHETKKCIVDMSIGCKATTEHNTGASMVVKKLEQRCQPGWREFNGTCYFFGTAAKKWTVASEECKQKHSRLVQINNKDENDWLGLQISGSSFPDVWIGLNDLAVEGTWVWENDLNTVEFKHWRPFEPNNYAGNEDCVSLYKTSGYVWNDEPCTFLKGYICEQ